MLSDIFEKCFTRSSSGVRPTRVSVSKKKETDQQQHQHKNQHQEQEQEHKQEADIGSAAVLWLVQLAPTVQCRRNCRKTHDHNRNQL